MTTQKKPNRKERRESEGFHGNPAFQPTASAFAKGRTLIKEKVEEAKRNLKK